MPFSLERRRVPYRRHRQGLRHDPSQHGHHARIYHHRCGHRAGASAKGAALRSWTIPSTWSAWTAIPPPTTWLSVLANGLAGNPEITEENADYQTFMQALYSRLLRTLAKRLAGDGEGRHQAVRVHGHPCARSDKRAKKMAKSVICSSLFKAAMFGADANWGRDSVRHWVYSDAAFDMHKMAVEFSPRKRGCIHVCENGAGVAFSEEDRQKDSAAKKRSSSWISIWTTARACATAWGCDLTYDYVKINGDYRT